MHQLQQVRGLSRTRWICTGFGTSGQSADAAGQQPAHYRGDGTGVRSSITGEGVGHQRPYKTRRLGSGQDIAEPIQEIMPVGIIREYLSPEVEFFKNPSTGTRGG